MPPWLDEEPLPRPRWRMALLLFLLTLVSTTVVGARLQYNFSRGLPAYGNATDLFPFGWAWQHPERLAAGLPFSLALLGILLAHELGHYFACRHYGLDSTYPMFLPTPTLIGTMGAFIRIKSPFWSRRQVFDVGIAGPLAGIMVTLPLLVYGAATSRVLSDAQTLAWHGQWIRFGWPWLGHWAMQVIHPGVATDHIALSPVARAAWLGLLVTMLNLIPGAQLDGGHILYAFSPQAHRIASWGALGVLALAGWWYWPGWYVFAAMIGLMRVRHPYVPQFERLGWARVGLGVLALAIFLAAFTAAPVLS